MYCKFYGLKERPFNVTSDPNFFFLSGKHKEAIAHLYYGTTQRKGICVITGEIGAGKTTMCRFFLNQLGKNVKTAFILNPYFSELQLLEAIIKDFGIRANVKSRLAIIWELNKFLLAESERGNNVILIIDEAQNLSPRTLEQVRLLSNLETEKDKLLQIILVGQPQLNNKLQLAQLRQLQQRISVRYHIPPLAHDEMCRYINYRMDIAGAGGKITFTDEALRAVFDYSVGTPRLVNVLCDRALLAGFTQDTYTIDTDIINRCLGELNVDFANQGAV